MSDATTNDVEQALAGLATQPPSDLEHRVLAAVGLGLSHGVVDGPVGPVVVVFSGRGIRRCVPLEHWPSQQDEFADSVEVAVLPPSLATNLARTLETGRIGRLELDFGALTEFQRSVLEKTTEIPPGEMRPYGWIAREIGKPGAVRAVGSALNKNPIPIVVPCHRVNRGDGYVGNYAYGPSMKRDLLRHEGLDPDAADKLAERGVRLIGSDTTHTYCLPSCRHAVRITDAHRVEFTDAGRAQTAGYRPCRVCRPAATAA